MATNSTVCTESLMFGQIEGVYEGALTLCFPAVADGFVEFRIEPEVLFFPLRDPCLKIVSVKRLKLLGWEDITGQTYEQPISELLGKGHAKRRAYKVYIQQWPVKEAQEIKLTVKVTDKRAKYVFWWITDPDDPAGHIDVDPNDYQKRKDEKGEPVKAPLCIDPYGWGVGNDNTGTGAMVRKAGYKIVDKSKSTVIEEVRDRCPKFPVDAVRGTRFWVVTEVRDSKSALIFRPSNDGGDDYEIYAIPLKGKVDVHAEFGVVLRELNRQALCNGDWVYAVVWRRVKVKIYAMKDKDSGRVFYPGSQKLVNLGGRKIPKLHMDLVKAFGEVSDPDRNCYIEILPKDVNLQTEYKKILEEEKFHQYTLQHTNYHGPGKKHPLYSAQLLGADRDGTLPERGLGAVFPFPHAFVFVGEFPNKALIRSAFFRKDVLPALKDGMVFQLHIKRPQGALVVNVRLEDENRDGHIALKEFRNKVKEAATKTGIWNMLGFQCVIGENEAKINGRRFRVLSILISFPQEWELKIDSRDQKVRMALRQCGFPVGYFISHRDDITSTAIHEVGHVLNTRGTTIHPLSTKRGQKQAGQLADFYHWVRYYESSVSRTGGGFNSLKFCPLLVRYFRCFVNAYFTPEGGAFHD